MTQFIDIELLRKDVAPQVEDLMRELNQSKDYRGTITKFLTKLNEDKIETKIELIRQSEFVVQAKDKEIEILKTRLNIWVAMKNALDAQYAKWADYYHAREERDKIPNFNYPAADRQVIDERIETARKEIDEVMERFHNRDHSDYDAEVERVKLNDNMKEVAEALFESLALNINWWETSDLEVMQDFPEYKAVVKQGKTIYNKVAKGLGLDELK